MSRMRKRTSRTRRLAAGPKAGVAALALVWALTPACVGSEGGDAASGARRPEPGVSAAELRNAVVPDDVRRGGTGVGHSEEVAAHEYQIFEQIVVSASPRKTLHRLLVMFSDSRERLNETARVALDSIAAADSTVVAARVIVYLFRQSGPNEGDVIPVVWGEWVPAEGWAGADRDSRRRWHRTYVYSGVPPWSEGDLGGVPEPRQR